MHQRRSFLTRPKKIRHHLNPTLGRINNQLGDRTEKTVLEAFEARQKEGKLPRWLTGFERLPPGTKGKDFTFQTDVGEMYLDIKSSMTGVRKTEAHHPISDIIVMKIDFQHPLNLIYAHIMKELSSKRNMRLADKKLAEQTI